LESEEIILELCADTDIQPRIVLISLSNGNLHSPDTVIIRLRED